MTQSIHRITFEKLQNIAPAAIKSLIAISQSLVGAGLPRELGELVDIRASQINGCAFCIQFHINNARALGVPQGKLDLVAAWKEAGIFSPREMAALAWTEHLTRMTDGPDLEVAYAALRREFEEAEAVLLTFAIGTINQWNRVMGGFAVAPPIPATTN